MNILLDKHPGRPCDRTQTAEHYKGNKTALLTL